MLIHRPNPARRQAIWLVVALAGLFLALTPRSAGAANPAGDLRIEVLAAYNLVVDSNVESPSTYGPRSAMMGAQICNDGANALTNAFAFIGDYDPNGDTNPVDSTPGVYPSRTNPPTGQVGTFTLTHEGGSAGTADATRAIGTIAAGACVTQYWLVSYPQLDDNGDSVTRGVKPDDDLWLQFDIWATADDAGTPLRADVTRRVTLRNEISAMANKIWPQTTSKVPDQYLTAIGESLGWDTLAPGGGNTAYPGDSLVTQGIWYDLGNVGHGFDNDGDLVPDKNAWLQPVGDPASFDAGCFRLIRTYGILIVKLRGGGELLLPFEDQLYFQHIPDNTGAVGLVFYEFVALNGACTAGLTPYQEVASGFDNEKFNGDFGYGIPPLGSSPPAVTLDKSVNQTTIGPALPASLTYTLAFSNTGTVEAGDPSVGVPLVLTDAVPAGTTYVAGSAGTGNTLPAGVTAYTVRTSCDGGATWQDGECSGVTHIQWWLSDPLAPATGGSITFQTTVPAGYTAITVPNTGGAAFGAAKPFAEDTVTTFRLGNNSLGDRVFADNGAGGGTLGNGQQEGSEAGIAGVSVTLYYDANGDGLLDAGDILWDTPTTPNGVTTTNGTGVYGFANLPDGRYLVVVNPDDAAIASGYTNTRPTAVAVPLDPDGTNPSPVSVLTADFAFAPALTLDKQVAGGGTIYEGQTIQYTISLRNRLPGSGVPGDNSCVFTAWATTEASQSSGQTANKRFSNSISSFIPPTNAFGASGPDDLYANGDFGTGGNQLIAGTGYGLGTYPGTITSVQALFRVYVSQNLVSDSALGTLFFNDVANPTTRAFTTSELNTRVGIANVGLLTWDVTSLRTWSFADFAGNLDLQFANVKDASPDNGRIYIDAMGFRVTTNQSCPATDEIILNPVPLSDTYDSSRLTFVSAEPPADGIAGATLSWDNLGPIYPGQTKNVVLTFKALQPSPNPQVISNTAAVTGATYADGRPANNASDVEPATLRATGSIAGILWSEGAGGTSGWVNPNGYEASFDTFIPGAKVTLHACTSTTTGALIFPGDTGKTCLQNGGQWLAIDSKTTGTGGAYLFEGLLNGYYYVSVDGATIPGTETQTGDPNVRPGLCGASCDNLSGNPSGSLGSLTYGTIGSANDITNVNFGYSVPPALYGTVWEDHDGDGVRDTGDHGIPNVTVQLYDATCTTLVTTAVTDASGRYTFGNLTAGTSYCVKTLTSSLPDAAGSTWTETAETDGSVNNQIVVTAQAGVLSGSHNFGFNHSDLSSIGDTLYYDWDGDGTQDAADEGIPSITVWLYSDTDGNGVVNPSTDPLIATDVTDADGQYLFTNLPADNYIVVVDRNDADWPAGFVYAQSGDPDEAGACSRCDSRGTSTIDGTNPDLAQDFGYYPTGTGVIGDTVWFDQNGDGAQSGVRETGLAGITVELWADPNGDGTFTLVNSTLTNSSGGYRFGDLPLMDYEVRVSATDPALPTDAFGNALVPTTATTRAVTLTAGAPTVLTADVGFAALGALGDTIFWDSNGNGTQDTGEPGIDGVTVTVYRDVDGDGFYTPGTDTYVADTTTATSGGSAGKYLFTGLPADDYVVVVGAIAGDPALTADPNADGVPCTDPSVAAVCDGVAGVTLRPGDSFMGADFGYQPPGVIGDTLWIDGDGDGARDDGESSIPYITVHLYQDTDNNGSYETLVTSTETDAAGNYSFANLADGTYQVVVDGADGDFPAGLTQTTDPDGTADGQGDGIVVAGGVVTEIGGATCADCDLDVDFGYRFLGAHSLSGTVCQEQTVDGVCGSGSSGVGAGELAYSGTPVYLLLWTDDGDSIVEAGETRQIATTQTDANGDYSFGSLPAGTFIVSLAAPADDLTFTTTGGYNPAVSQVTGFTATDGDASSAYQVVTVAAAVTNVDFAFDSSVDYDYGDLPETYNAAPTSYGTTYAANGPRHIVPASPSLYLGTSPPDTELDGQPDPLANGDGADEDGVVYGQGPGGVYDWDNGANGGSVDVTVAGSGWLVMWIDFNNDGDFTDAGEMAISQAVSSGSFNVQFDVPANTFCPDNDPGCSTSANPSGTLFARARLVPAAPPVPALAYTGPASGGEVEDLLFQLSPTAIRLLSGRADSPAASGWLWLALAAAMATVLLLGRRATGRAVVRATDEESTRDRRQTG